MTTINKLIKGAFLGTVGLVGSVIKIPSLTLSIVGRVLRPSILSNGLLLWIPEITLIEKHFHSLSYFYIIHTA